MLTRCIAIALACCFAIPAAASAAPPVPVLDPEELALCRQINDYRAQRGVAPLRVSAARTRAASWHSSDMARHDYFDHTDSRGRSFSMRTRAFRLAGASHAENIAAGASSAAGTLEQWRNSPGHRRNMLSARYKVVGIGRARNAASTFGWYWTTTFGAIRDRTIPC